MFKINLVPEVQEKAQQKSKTNYSVTAISLSVLGGITIALVILGGIVLSQKAMITSTEKNIAEVNSELEQYKELEETVVSLENGLASAKQIIDGNNAWTKLLPHIEKATPADIKYTKLALENGKITASLEGRDINSLARFVESFKKYELYALTGTGTSGEKIKIILDGAAATEVTVKTNGQWVYPITFDPAINHTIDVENAKGDNIDKISYDAAKKEITSENGAVSVQKKNLYTNVEVSQYKKNGGAVSFDTTMNFDGGMIW